MGCFSFQWGSSRPPAWDLYARHALEKGLRSRVRRLRPRSTHGPKASPTSHRCELRSDGVLQFLAGCGVLEGLLRNEDLEVSVSEGSRGGCRDQRRFEGCGLIQVVSSAARPSVVAKHPKRPPLPLGPSMKTFRCESVVYAHFVRKNGWVRGLTRCQQKTRLSSSGVTNKWTKSNVVALFLKNKSPPTNWLTTPK